jgi:tripartite-type tricarboxylate transporter receptor subunit TctC
VDPTNKEYIDMGKVRVISFLSKKKLPGYERIPSTFEMYGVANCNLMGVVGPKGLPSYVAKTLENAFAKGVKEPSFVSLMGKIYYDIIYMTGEEMGQYIMKTYNEYKEIIKQLKEDEAKK